MRILDVGCGTGGSRIYEHADVVGIDIDPERVAVAQKKHPSATFYAMSAEQMSSLPDNEFDEVVSNVALPYMNIPLALAEMHRVLKPGGAVHLTLHNPGFTLKELRRSFPRPKPTAFRLFVLANGLWFHLTGRVLRIASRSESFQTIRGIRKALQRAGFAGLEFPPAKQFVVRAIKPVK